MINEIDKLGEIYKLLISGDYVEDNTISFLDFIKILRSIKSCRNFSKCFGNSHMEMSSFLGIVEFLRNVNIIKLVDQKRIEIQNDEIFSLIYSPPSRGKMILKLARNLPQKYLLLRSRSILSKYNLLKLFKPKFILSSKNFQLPCSLKSSFRRVLVIAEHICFSSQKALFIGDDDLISILCKLLIPELPITVVEIDGRITKLLKKVARKYKFKNFEVYNRNFKEDDEIEDLLKYKYSIIHLDPPYEATELKIFFKNIEVILDEKLNHIFLNGLYNTKCMSILNQFIERNNLVLTEYHKSFNSYPLKPVDQKYLKRLRKYIKFENNLKFKGKKLKDIELFSDLYVIERGWIEKS
ncbi:MAG: bis-aminopropyl spermidine synthase family protein [Promethearchaeota archaeon]